jgi:hypothetical protein
MEASVRSRGADAPSPRPSESLSHSGTAEEKTDIGGNIRGNTRNFAAVKHHAPMMLFSEKSKHSLY